MPYSVVANCLLIIFITLVNGMPQKAADTTYQEKSEESVSTNFLLCYIVVITTHKIPWFFFLYTRVHLLRERIYNMIYIIILTTPKYY